jgi:uncharacterized Zn finger protein (UPF0148 family)
MSEDPDGAAASPNRTCVLCSKPLAEGGVFCPFCGAEAVPSSTTATIDAYVQNKINSALSDRLKDQSSLVRELADQAEDIVWKRLKGYGIISGALVACILGIIAFVGFNTLGDVSKKIEPIVKAAEQRAQAAKRTIDETAKKVDSVKAAVDQLSRDVDTQTKRVADKGGEISQKFERLDAGGDEFSRRLTAMEKSLETRVAQVSKQVDNVSIQQAFPTLGQQKFVTYNGGQWKGRAAKGAKEKWINFFIDPTSLADFSTAQMEKLLAALEASGYTPLVNMFGIGGPYFTGSGPLGTANQSAVFYFQHNSEQMAVDVAAIVSKTLSIKGVVPRFVDVSAFNPADDRRFLIENSGLDLQVYLYRPH